ncbi:MAG: hypothetical protein K6C94_08775 [Candidatus Gastranaerophilales bacterium]|nr:hypothetical protein [Candidatus Gastranaerophilales bacterium]
MSYVIDAETNAARHNNLGIIWLRERYYYGAIKEFEIAINLNPNSQASSVYYNNLGRTYITIGYPELAEAKFLMAIKKYPLNFEYYVNLVEAYGKQNKTAQKLEYHKKHRKNNIDDILIALLYGALGQTSTEVTMLDEFCNNEPDLIITPAVRRYVSEQAKYLRYNQKNMQ